MITTVIVAGLAGARLTRAWLHETVAEPIRKPIQTWADKVDFYPVETPEGHTELVVETSPRMLEVKSKVDELINCPHCMGYWLTLGCLLALRFRLTRPLSMALAGAMIVSTFADHYPAFDPTSPERAKDPDNYEDDAAPTTDD